MKKSIRKFLLVNLLIAISITTTLTAIGNFYLDQQDIQDHLDTLMAVSGLSYKALLGDSPSQRNLSHIQESLHNLPKSIYFYLPPLHPEKPNIKDYINRFSFQLLQHHDNKPILYSPEAPDLSSLDLRDGFSTAFINGIKWRIFNTSDHKSQSQLILAERFDTRKDLSYRIALDDIYIMLITFPLSGLLIWIIIGRGLASLDKVAKEVAHRAPNHLEPVNLKATPEEIVPIVDELNKLFFRLQEGFEREKRFAADAAHELRTPLAAIKTQAQVALNTNHIEEKNHALQKLIVSVNRTTHIVQQLLTISKLVPDATDNSWFEPIKLTQVSRDMVAMLAPKAIEKDIDLEFHPTHSTPSILGNETALSILVRNLVDNAIRYTPASGKVDIIVRPESHYVLLEIIDDGPGIPEELKNRVFERFFRVVGHHGKGSGLGLAIVKQIIELHHAHIELLTPESGIGLQVKVLFPCCPAHSEHLPSKI